MKTRYISTLALLFLLSFTANADSSSEGCYNDYIPPVAVCEGHTVVSLTSDGKATLYAESLDDGSHDNCGIDHFKAARMVPGWCPPGVVDDTQFRDYVQFCCEDIGPPVWVILRVIDKNGNYNDCMTEVIVQDKLPPTIHCPYDKSISCEYWYNPEELYDPYSPVFGAVSAYDNCGLEYVYVHVDDNTSCKVGKIKRIFTAVDWGGAKSTCVQNVWVTDGDPFNKYDIDWPKDYTGPGCGYVSTDPDDLPYGFDRPRWEDKNCSLIGAAYEDLAFEFVEGVCKKILRTWKVIDWCQFDPYNPYSKGIWEHVQVIKLIDHDKPQFENCKDTIVPGYEPNCAGKVVLDPGVWDHCTPKDKLNYEYKVDIHANGTIDIRREDRMVLNEILPVGTHKVLWFVDDGCGNLATCSYYVTVVDEKPPTPICYAQLSTVVMPAGGMVTLWAKDFDASSYDNCTPVNKLRFHFRPNKPNSGSKTFNCDFIGTNQIKVYVTDLKGNTAYCRVMLTIGDNENVCEDMNPLSGAVTSFSGAPVTQASVQLYKVMHDSSMLMDTEDATDIDGAYLTGFGTTDYNRMLKVEKNGFPLEGISSLDLLMLKQHVLGVQVITDPAMLYAADIDGSGHVGVNDLLMLRDAFLSNGRSLAGQDLPWLFYPEECEWIDGQLDSECHTDVSIDKDNPPLGELNFIGVKKGDVDGTLLTELTGHSPSGLDLVLNVSQPDASGSVKVSAVAENTLSIAGFQMSMISDWFGSDSDLLFHEGRINVRSNDYRIEADDRSFNLSWLASRELFINAGDELFSFEIDGRSADRIMKEVNLEGMFQDQVYLVNQSALPLTLSWGRVAVSGGDQEAEEELSTGSDYVRPGFEHNTGRISNDPTALAMMDGLKVWPNPTYGETLISFNAAEEGEVRVEVFTGNLSMVHNADHIMVKGMNEIVVPASAFDTPGVYYFRISGASEALTGRVVFMH